MESAFVSDVIGMASYHDRTPICYSEITGGGQRFHGFRTFKFGRGGNILKKYQKNVKFKHNAAGVLEIEARSMVNWSECTGVVSPHALGEAPHNLSPLGRPVHAGAVSRHRYKWNPGITDALLHKLCQHPEVLDVWVQGGSLSVMVMHDRDIVGGLCQHLQATGKHRACGRLSRSGASRSYASWKPLSRRMKPRKRLG